MKITTKNCQCCHYEFQAKRSDAKFCSGACKQYEYLKREKSKIIQNESEKVQIETELSDRLRELQKKIAELVEEREAKKQLQIDEHKKIFEETLEKIRNDRIQSEMVYANSILKGWFLKLLDFDDQKEVYKYKVKSFYEGMINSYDNTFASLSIEYKYLPFINYTLIPKVKRWYEKLNHLGERYISIELSTEFRKEITDILSEID